MNDFKCVILGLCLFSCSCSAKTLLPSAADEIQPAISVTTDSLGFPETWVGTWLGELSIYKASGLVQKLPMELLIQPTDSAHRFTWTIIYGEDKEAGARKYELVIKDRDKGEYLVDERNSIELECYLIGDKLFSWYLVMDNLILITNEKKGEEMIFEVVAGSHLPVSVTGGQKIEEEEIPEVSTYPVATFQQATLWRKK